MTNSERRTIELEFYLILQWIYNIKHNADFLVTMLEGLRFLVNFDINKVVHYANKFNLNVTWQPYKGEVVGMLYKYSNIPMNAICSALGISRVTGYRLADEFNKDPYETPPKVPEKDLTDLHNVILAYKKLRSAI